MPENKNKSSTQKGKGNTKSVPIGSLISGSLRVNGASNALSNTGLDVIVRIQQNGDVTTGLVHKDQRVPLLDTSVLRIKSAVEKALSSDQKAAIKLNRNSTALCEAYECGLITANVPSPADKSIINFISHSDVGVTFLKDIENRFSHIADLPDDGHTEFKKIILGFKDRVIGVAKRFHIRKLEKVSFSLTPIQECILIEKIPAWISNLLLNTRIKDIKTFQDLYESQWASVMDDKTKCMSIQHARSILLSSILIAQVKADEAKHSGLKDSEKFDAIMAELNGADGTKPLSSAAKALIQFRFTLPRALTASDHYEKSVKGLTYSQPSVKSGKDDKSKGKLNTYEGQHIIDLLTLSRYKFSGYCEGVPSAMMSILDKTQLTVELYELDLGDAETLQEAHNDTGKSIRSIVSASGGTEKKTFLWNEKVRASHNISTDEAEKFKTIGEDIEGGTFVTYAHNDKFITEFVGDVPPSRAHLMQLNNFPIIKDTGHLFVKDEVTGSGPYQLRVEGPKYVPKNIDHSKIRTGSANLKEKLMKQFKKLCDSYKISKDTYITCINEFTRYDNDDLGNHMLTILINSMRCNKEKYTSNKAVKYLVGEETDQEDESSDENNSDEESGSGDDSDTEDEE